MGFYLTLPIRFFLFWYVDAPKGLARYFVSLNNAFFTLFSLPLLLRTFFKPLKNEYREGLVGFSRMMGMLVKSFFIIADVFLFVLLLGVELCFFIGFLFLPIGSVLLLFL